MKSFLLKKSFYFIPLLVLPLNLISQQPPIRQLSLGNNADGRLELFALGGDNSVYHVWQIVPNGDWGDWRSLGGHDLQQIAVEKNADGRLEVFALGADKAIYHRWQLTPNGNWGDWGSLQGHDLQQIAVGRNADGRLELFALGADKVIYHRWQVVPNGDWNNWSSLQGHDLQQIAVGRNADGRLELFALGADKAVYHRWQVVPNGDWNNWSSLQGHDLQQIAVGRNTDGRLELFALGADKIVYHRWQVVPNGDWNNWSSLQGHDLQQIAVGRNADGRLELFALGADKVVYHRWQIVPNGDWNDWSSLQGHDLQKISVGNNADGRIELMVIGNDNFIYHRWQVVPNGDWNDWKVLSPQRGGYFETIKRGSDPGAWTRCISRFCLTPEWQNVEYARENDNAGLCAGSFTTSDFPLILEGVVHDSHKSTNDNFGAHQSYDWCAFIEPDFDYQYLLGSCNDTKNIMEFVDCNGERVTSHNGKVMEMEWETDDLPDKYRPQENDRACLMGRWIYDMGHPPNQTEIHPPQAVAFTRTVNATDVPQFLETRTYIYGRGTGAGGAEIPWTGSFYSIAKYNLNYFAMDYSFNIYLPPKPASNSTLVSVLVENTFGGPDPIIKIEPGKNLVNVTCPVSSYFRNNPNAKYGVIIHSSWKSP